MIKRVALLCFLLFSKNLENGFQSRERSELTKPITSGFLWAKDACHVFPIVSGISCYFYRDLIRFANSSESSREFNICIQICLCSRYFMFKYSLLLAFLYLYGFYNPIGFLLFSSAVSNCLQCLSSSRSQRQQSSNAFFDKSFTAAGFGWEPRGKPHKL